MNKLQRLGETKIKIRKGKRGTVWNITDSIEKGYNPTI